MFIFSLWGLFVSGFVISTKSVVLSWGLFATPRTRNLNYVPKLRTQRSSFGDKAITCPRLETTVSTHFVPDITQDDSQTPNYDASTSPKKSIKITVDTA